jgi:hypothetical protein
VSDFSSCGWLCFISSIQLAFLGKKKEIENFNIPFTARLPAAPSSSQYTFVNAIDRIETATVVRLPFKRGVAIPRRINWPLARDETSPRPSQHPQSAS